MKALRLLMSVGTTCLFGLAVLPRCPAGDVSQPAFGVLTDVQYGDKPDAGKRCYRKSLARLESAVRDLSSRRLLFVVHLGDLVDGYPGDPARSQADMNRVLEAFAPLRVPIRWVLGNHCLTVPRPVLLERLGLSSAYYEFTDPAARGWRFIVLDENYGNGGTVGPEQTAWLLERLTAAAEHQERVILFGHYPLETVKCRRHQKEAPIPLLECLRSYPCVVASFAGHQHAGGYLWTQGIHSVTVRGMVEATSNAYGVVELSDDGLREIGFGEEPSRMMRIGVPALPPQRIDLPSP